MAIYNELDTAAEAIDAVLAVDLPDVEVELIVVESNSSDGTRAVVTRYADHPRVKLVLQDAPRGKGNAVREGLRHASGGIILIQDADLEYSIDDYPILLAPIMDGRADFTLGCRHVPGQPIRVMHGNRTVMAVVNSAHWVFLALFNLTYRTHLRDPFTMYKVFRSECIEGVEFVADRFDFDWELVAKLVRLGYEPLELPIQYTARTSVTARRCASSAIRPRGSGRACVSGSPSCRTRRGPRLCQSASRSATTVISPSPMRTAR